MVESDHAEERLARVERMLAQRRRESAALKAIAAVESSSDYGGRRALVGAKRTVQPAKPKRSD